MPALEITNTDYNNAYRSAVDMTRTIKVSKQTKTYRGRRVENVVSLEVAILNL